MTRYTRIKDWIADMKRHVRNDWDLGLLATGPVGVGKSTIVYQVLKALDQDGFGPGPDRVHFTIQDALAAAHAVPRYGSWLLDEAHISGRKAMFGEIQRLNDYLQLCRGLNHQWGLCFHQEKRVDKPIMERVHYNLHVPRRGLVKIRVLKPNWERQREPWKVIASFRFNPNTGKEWATYKRRKDAHMAKIQDADGPGPQDLGIDYDALQNGIATLKATIEA